MKLKIVIEGRLMQVMSVYAPQIGRTEEEKEEFWGTQDDTYSDTDITF